MMTHWGILLKNKRESLFNFWFYILATKLKDNQGETKWSVECDSYPILKDAITINSHSQWEGRVARGGCPQGSDQTRHQRREAGDLRVRNYHDWRSIPF